MRAFLCLVVCFAVLAPVASRAVGHVEPVTKPFYGISIEKLESQARARERQSATLKLVRATIECLSKHLLADKRLKSSGIPLVRLIEDAMPKCTESIDAMIDGYDQYYGDGAGLEYFRGKYLILLPAFIRNWLGIAE